MAIASVTIPQVRGRSAGRNALWQRTYKRFFRVTTTDPTNEGPMILGAVDPITSLAIPAIGSSYFNTTGNRDFGSFAQSIDADQDSDDGLSWLVTVEYGPYDANLFSANPVDWPLKCVFGGKTYERIVYYDNAGNPILNSAGDPFSDPLTEDDLWSTLTCTRNELVSTFGFTFASTYSNRLNLSTWNTFGGLTVKSGIITTSEEQYDSNNQVYYLNVTYPFEIKSDGWARELVDRGFYQLVSGQRRLMLDANGQKFDEPQLLDGSGHQLAVGGTPSTQTVHTKQTIDFAGFGIDLTTRLGH